MVHSEVCFTTGDIAFCNGPTRLVGSDVRMADIIDVIIRASNVDQKRVGVTSEKVRTDNTERWLVEN